MRLLLRSKLPKAGSELCDDETRKTDRKFMVALANVYAQTIASFEESNRMYAIPAETATQGEPFQKENLPGPGK